MEDKHGRSFFWPVIMIAVGVIWLLGNLDIGIPPFNFFLLLQLWPLLLIVGGINLIIGRRWPLLRAVVTLLAVAGALAYVYLAPSYGLVSSGQVQHAEFSEALDGAESATIIIDSSVGRVSLEALTDSSDLFTAEVDYIGEIDFEVEGDADRTVRLEAESQGFDSDWLNGVEPDELVWTLGLSPEVPITLVFSSGVGAFDVDLSGLMLESVRLSSGVGETDLLLPAQDQPYSVRVEGGVGRLQMVIEDGAEIDLTINGGVGEIIIDVPEDAGVEVRADLGVGNVSVPGGYELISGSDRPIGSSGTWQSENFAEAAYMIEIEFDGGVGNLVIR